MKELQKLHDQLGNLRYDLFDNYRTSFKDKFEQVGSFMEDDLEDAISTIDQAIDRIEELENELDKANERIEELERELDEAV